MSRSDSDAIHTPERKSSSSALLDAFRTLTSTRVRSATPTSPSSTATLAYSPGDVPSIDDLRLRKDSRTKNDADGVLLDPERDNSRNRARDSPSSSNKVLGGPPGLQRLLRELGPKQAARSRIDAANEVVFVLEEYPIRNIMAIWELGKDLIDEGKSEKESLAGYHLLKACIRRSEMTGYERWAFYDSISLSRTPGNLDRRLQALMDLTDHGRNIEGIENLVPCSLAPVLEEAFEKTLAEREERKMSKKAQAIKEGKRAHVNLPSPKEEKTFYSLLEYSMEITKYSAKSFLDKDISNFLDTLLSICKKTHTENDIAKSLEVVSAVVSRFYIANPMLSSCLEVLCDIIHQLAGLRDAAHSIVESMLRSHLGHAAIKTLLDLVRQSPLSNVGITSLRGAVFVLHKAVLSETESDFPAVPLAALLHSLRCSLAFKGSSKVDRLEADVLVFVTDLIEHPAIVGILAEEQDLTELLLIVETCLSNRSSRLHSQANISETAERYSSPHRSVSATTTLSDDHLSNPSSLYDRIITSLVTLSVQMDTPLESNIVDLLLRSDYTYFSTEASKFITNYFLDQNLLSPSREHWLSDTKRLVEIILQDRNKPTDVRVHTVEILDKAYGTVEAVAPHDTATQFASLVLENIIEETNMTVQKALLDFAISVAQHASDSLFQNILGFLEASIVPKRASSYVRPSSDLPPHKGGTRLLNPFPKINTECVVRMFLLHLNRSASRAKILYEFLLHIAEHVDCDPDARVTALKLLFRLRSDANHRIVVIPAAESERLAASLCRTVESAAKAKLLDDEPSRASQTSEDIGSSPTPRAISGGTSSSRSRLTRRSASTPVARASRPAWMYPGPEGLPQEPPSNPSPVLFSSLEHDDDSFSDHRQTLEVGRLVELVISTLQQGADWEVYSYIIVHLGAQLTNQPLFRETIPQIKHLRNVVCEQVRNQTFYEPPSSTGLKKSDVAICIFHTLTMLISYHSHFGKNEQDDTVKMFVLGIGARERTAKDCIHALSVCCHEMPGSVVKSMDQILHKMSQIITQSHIAVHILEFLTTVARLPDLFRNFRDEDYKMVLGICFRYLQYVRDQKGKITPQTPHRMSQASTLRHSGTSREFAAVAEQEDHSRYSTNELPQYVYALAFHVITFWFMSMKIQDRPKQLPFIMANLTYSDPMGRSIMEEQGQVTMDMIERVAYSDRDETAPTPNFAGERDGLVSKRTWIVGHSVLTVETASRSGLSQITRRRPTCTKYSIYQPRLIDPPSHQVPFAIGVRAELYHTSDFVGICPEDIVQEYYAPMSIASHGSSAEHPILLTDDEAVDRALNSFDRISALDSHKIGVIYADGGQMLEKDILGNISGPDDYTAFINGLGTLVRLQGSTMNMQGLDRNTDTDGQYTYCWRDRVTEIVYHITTMMPTYSEDDPRYHQKKMHVGNDFVNIVWNNSGHPFHPDTIPSQVTMIYIVITPEAHTSFRSTQQFLDTEDTTKARFYKVQVLTKSDLPSVSPAADTKLISGYALPSFVRLLALNASVFSNVWIARDPSGNNHDSYISSWRARLQVIKQLRERYAQPEPIPVAVDRRKSGVGESVFRASIASSIGVSLDAEGR